MLAGAIALSITPSEGFIVSLTQPSNLTSDDEVGTGKILQFNEENISEVYADAPFVATNGTAWGTLDASGARYFLLQGSGVVKVFDANSLAPAGPDIPWSTIEPLAPAAMHYDAFSDVLWMPWTKAMPGFAEEANKFCSLAASGSSGAFRCYPYGKFQSHLCFPHIDPATRPSKFLCVSNAALHPRPCLTFPPPRAVAFPAPHRPRPGRLLVRARRVCVRRPRRHRLAGGAAERGLRAVRVQHDYEAHRR